MALLARRAGEQINKTKHFTLNIIFKVETSKIKLLKGILENNNHSQISRISTKV